MTESLEPWQQRLKDAIEAGYYKRDAALSDQAAGEPFPWQGKTCRDCPYFRPHLSRCDVHREYRSPTSPTCRFFDESNRSEADRLLWDGGSQPNP